VALLDPDAAPPVRRGGIWKWVGVAGFVGVVGLLAWVMLGRRGSEPVRPSPRTSAPATAKEPRAASSATAPPSLGPRTVGASAAPPARQVAGLRIESDIPGATVFVDKRYVGEAPLTLRDLAPGPHTVNASAEGYEMQVETVEVSGGAQTVELRFKEVRLDASAEVVHKHAIGSCRGRLLATPAGLRYESSKPEDAFTVPLDGIAENAVDYLDKTLKLRLKSGKTYRFGPASGGPDALLVFQQQVEKARRAP
jgi:hypothetical protein